MHNREIIRIVSINPKSLRVIWVKAINSNVPLPIELEFVKTFRNRVPVRHLYQHQRGNSVLACGTKYYTGNFVIETTRESDVNCKRCLKQLGIKNNFIDVLIMRTSVPIESVRIKNTNSRNITDEDIGKEIILDDWIFEAKLKASNYTRQHGWFVEVHRLNRIAEKETIENLKEKYL